MNQRTRWLFKLGVAGIALVAAFTLVEPAAWSAAIAQPKLLLPALAGWLANQCFCAMRFFVLANWAGVPIALAPTLRMTLIGFFAGCIFGGFAANDAVRALMLRRQATDAHLSRLLLLIVLDRLLGLTAFALWALALSYVALLTLDPAMTQLVSALRIAGFALLAAFVVVVTLVALASRLRTVPRLNSLARIYAATQIAREARMATGLMLAFPLALLACGAVILAQGWIGNEIALSLGHPSSLALQTFLAPASIIISILPLVPLGLGIGQLTLSGLYAVFGLPAEVAILLTTLMQIAQFAVAVSLGGMMLLIARSATRVRD